jgi:putative transposase
VGLFVERLQASLDGDLFCEPQRASWFTADVDAFVVAQRVERIWRQEGLKVPQKQPKKGGLWLNDGSCIQPRPEYPNHVWSYDFVEDRTHMPLSF